MRKQNVLTNVENAIQTIDDAIRGVGYMGRTVMNQRIVEICHTLVQAGAVPGSDFSLDPNSNELRLNEDSYNLLRRLYPDIAQGVVTQPNVQGAIDMLHSRLGTGVY